MKLSPITDSTLFVRIVHHYTDRYLFEYELRIQNTYTNFVYELRMRISYTNYIFDIKRIRTTLSVYEQLYSVYVFKFVIRTTYVNHICSSYLVYELRIQLGYYSSSNNF